MYSVKLKLELNILSKLVDLVHMDSSDHSMAIDAVTASDSRGQEQDDLRKEMDVSKPRSLDNMSSNDTRSPSDAADHAPNADGISQVATRQSNLTARTTGRESDMMYADMLRSLTR